MKNKTILMASALLIGGLLTLNNSVFADVVDATTSASIKQDPAQTGKMFREKQDNIKHQQFGEMEKGGMFKEGWGMQLDALVAAGTITQTTADKIQAYLDAEQATFKAEMEKVKAMTDDERETYFQNFKSKAPERLDMLSNLVQKGVITQIEADAINAVQNAKQAEENLIQQAKKQEYVTSALNSLVKSNVITAEQVTKITEYMFKEQAVRETEMVKIKAMTEEERTAYLKSHAENKGTMFAQLVTDKVLTQAQADAIEKVLHPKESPKDFDRGPFKK
jgi:hypothetical protein